MVCSLLELRRKEVIDLQTGAKLGYVDDIELDIETATLLTLVIFGRERLWGLLGRESDLIIPFEKIRLIGRDTILIRDAVSGETSKETKRRAFSFKSL